MKDKCDYCGENKAMIKIFNPNMEEEPIFWEVCITCDKVIKQQQKLTMGSIISSKPNGDIGRKMVKEAQQRLKEISYEADVPILSIECIKEVKDE